MTPTMYILLIFAILLTIANITLLYRSRKNKRLATEKYHQLLKSLRDRTIKVMKRQGLHFDKTYPIVSDTDEGFLFCLDTVNRKVSFTDSREVRICGYEDLIGCEVQVEDSDDIKYYEKVRVVAELASAQKPLVFQLGTKRNKRNGIMGKFILDTANQLRDVIQKVIALDPSMLSDHHSDVKNED